MDQQEKMKKDALVKKKTRRLPQSSFVKRLSWENDERPREVLCQSYTPPLGLHSGKL
jgi:hypothetical protein